MHLGIFHVMYVVTVCIMKFAVEPSGETDFAIIIMQ